MKYRSDIDGLRAVAVVPVVLSHAGFSLFAGGFVGVDIFFVISGFLITKILIGEMQNGTYSLAKFYERRARRILPALLLVICVAFPFAWLLMLPDFLQNFGQSVVATLLFSNNLLLAKTSGYWELESSFKPLLHTWSLGVEEQFYIVFPVFLALVWKFGRKWQMVSVLVLGLLSFSVAELGWRTNSQVNFYLPTGRAWELMVGCLIAYQPRVNRRFDNLFSSVGLVAILISVFCYQEDTPSPSIFMALPVFGTGAILLFSRPGTLCWRILSLPPMVGIGLVSYSFYLWHQPLYALLRVGMVDEPSKWVLGFCGLVALGLAWLTWKFVETPFRSSHSFPLRRLLMPFVGTSVALVAAGLFLHVSQGLPKRIYPNIADASDVYIGYNERIRQFTIDDFPDNGRRNILVIGNSYARDIANTLIEAGLLDDANLIYFEAQVDELASVGVSEELANLLANASVTAISIQHGGVSEITESIGLVRGEAKGAVITFGTKHFGANLNPYGRVPVAERSMSRSEGMPSFVALNTALSEQFQDGSYVDVFRLLGEDGQSVAVFDGDGNPLSPDRVHLTKYGAVFLADRIASRRPDIYALFSSN